MKLNKVLLSFLAFVPIALSPQADLNLPQKSAVELITQVAQSKTTAVDKRPQILENYLSKFDSPAKIAAKDFVDAADAFGVDWRLLPAIAGTESTFCKFVPGGLDYKFSSFNCWGWGVYGDQAIYFKSYRDGIFKVTQGLKENYINKGLTDPYKMNRAYAASPAWGWKVDYFMKDLDSFTKSYLDQEAQINSQKKEQKVNLVTDYFSIDKTAAHSGELTYKAN